MGGLGNAGVRIEHNEHWQGLVDRHRDDVNGTRQRFKQGFALILNQCRQVKGADRQHPSLGRCLGWRACRNPDRRTKPNKTQQFVWTGTTERERSHKLLRERKTKQKQHMLRTESNKPRG